MRHIIHRKQNQPIILPPHQRSGVGPLVFAENRRLLAGAQYRLIVTDERALGFVRPSVRDAAVLTLGGVGIGHGGPVSLLGAPVIDHVVLAIVVDHHHIRGMAHAEGIIGEVKGGIGKDRPQALPGLAAIVGLIDDAVHGRQLRQIAPAAVAVRIAADIGEPVPRDRVFHQPAIDRPLQPRLAAMNRIGRIAYTGIKGRLADKRMAQPGIQLLELCVINHGIRTSTSLGRKGCYAHGPHKQDAGVQAKCVQILHISGATTKDATV